MNLLGLSGLYTIIYIFKVNIESYPKWFLRISRMIHSPCDFDGLNRHTRADALKITSMSKVSWFLVMWTQQEIIKESSPSPQLQIYTFWNTRTPYPKILPDTGSWH